MASRTLPFPAARGFSQSTSTWHRSPLQAPRLEQNARFMPAETSRVSSTGLAPRLHVVGRTPASATHPQPAYSAFSPAAQAQRVAAQVDWEIARQARRRPGAVRPAGTLLLLPVRVRHQSLRSRAARALLRLLSPHRPLSH